MFFKAIDFKYMVLFNVVDKIMFFNESLSIFKTSEMYAKSSSLCSVESLTYRTKKSKGTKGCLVLAIS